MFLGLRKKARIIFMSMNSQSTMEAFSVDIDISVSPLGILSVTLKEYKRNIIFIEESYLRPDPEGQKPTFDGMLLRELITVVNLLAKVISSPQIIYGI